MFPTVPGLFSHILYGELVPCFWKRSSMHSAFGQLAVRLFYSYQTLKERSDLPPPLTSPDRQLECPSLLLGPAPLPAPHRTVGSSRMCCCAAQLLLCPPFLIADSVMAQKQRQPTTKAFSRGSELILAQSVGTKEINFFWMRPDKKLMWMLIW